MLCRTTLAGMTIKFIKSDTSKCFKCKYSIKSIFKNNYKCGIILGLNLDDGEYGHCGMYESSK